LIVLLIVLGHIGVLIYTYVSFFLSPLIR
jgi:hypothetical protein